MSAERLNLGTQQGLSSDTYPATNPPLAGWVVPVNLYNTSRVQQVQPVQCFTCATSFSTNVVLSRITVYHQVANLPLVPGCPIPKELYEIDQTRIVGLTIDPHVLSTIRRNRLGMMGLKQMTGISNVEYAELKKVNEELEWARALFRRNPGWPVLDVTLRYVCPGAACSSMLCVLHLQPHPADFDALQDSLHLMCCGSMRVVGPRPTRVGRLDRQTQGREGWGGGVQRA